MKKTAFLEMVREAAVAGRSFRVHTRDDFPPDVGYLGAGSDPLDRMAEEVTAVGGVSHVVSNHQEARTLLGTLLQEYAPRTALCWKHPVLDRVGLAGLLEERKVIALDHDNLAPIPEAERRLRILSADIGISSVEYAVAESGTIAVCAGPGKERVVSLLPKIYIAVVEAMQIVPDLFDLFSDLEKQGLENLPSNLTLITGPSKSGDIELKLTTGVHGPGKWHVILIR